MPQKSNFNSPVIILALIMVLAAALRLYMLSLNMEQHRGAFHYDRKLLKEKLRAADTPFQHPFGAEVANVAYSIACKKEGLSNPFGDSTGPTGWVAPGMAVIYACSFYIFGCYTFKAIVFLFVVAMCLSLGMIFLVYRLSIILYGNTSVGYLAALLFALSPHDLRVFKHIDLQDFNFMIFLFLLVIYVLLLFFISRTAKHLIFLALATVAAVLCNPIFILPILVSLLFTIVRSKQRIMACFQFAVFLGIVILLIFPYILYQYKQMHAWTFIKSNGMFELYLGNVPDFNGVLVNELFKKYHPIMNKNEFLQYKAMGEIEYIRSRGSRFLENFDSVAFIKRTVHRIYNFFFLVPPFTFDKGLMRQLLFSRGLILVLYVLMYYKKIDSREKLLYLFILCYILPYCLSSIMYRYSIPIVSVEMVFAAFIFYQTFLTFRGMWYRKKFSTTV